MTDHKFSVSASTPQEFKEAVVKWLNSQATIHRANARMARTVRWEKENNDKADTLEYAAKFIYEIVIEQPTPSVMTEDELMKALEELPGNRRSDEV